MARDYFALVEGFEATSAWFRSAAPADQEQAGRSLEEEAIALLCNAPEFEKVAVWHIDKLYRLLNVVPFIDASSFVFLRALGTAFNGISRARGVSVAYLVDNALPDDRLRGVSAAFAALGLRVASPELMAMKLSEADGPAAGSTFEHYRVEATMLAMRVFSDAIAENAPVAWLSGTSDIDTLRRLASALDKRPYIGVFRNDAPVEGTTVLVFRSGGRSEALAF